MPTPAVRVAKMSEFSRYHPLVTFVYFLFAILLTCANFNPIFIGISFLSAFTFCAVVKGKKALLKNLVMMPLLFILMTAINPTFNHRGITILAYLPSGNPLTFESICFGFMAAGMLLSVMLWFSCFNEIMTSDKIIYVFGRIIPSLSLIFSMTLRAVPRFSEQFKKVSKAQKCVGRSMTEGTLLERIKSGIAIFSAMITWSMENAIETADSMKARGFGTSKRTAFSIYTFTKRDKTALFPMLLFGAYIISGGALGVFEFSCFPSIKMAGFSLFALSFYTAELLFLSMPVIIEISGQRAFFKAVGYRN